MNTASNAPRRPALRFYGGKWSVAPWILSHLPHTASFCVPFAGGLSVLLRKPPSKLETVNDLDGRTINFFRVLRECPDDLVRAIRLTPWAEDEFRLSREIADDPREDARRFFVHCWTSMQGGPTNRTGFRIQRTSAARGTTPPQDIINIDHLYVVAERLKRVQILSRDARDVIELFRRKPDCLIYCDPPYLRETRASKTGYVHDSDPQLHTDIAALLCAEDTECLAAISGYASGLYTELYEARGWLRHDRTARVNGDRRVGGNTRVESLWVSPRMEIYHVLSADREAIVSRHHSGPPKCAGRTLRGIQPMRGMPMARRGSMAAYCRVGDR